MAKVLTRKPKGNADDKKTRIIGVVDNREYKRKYMRSNEKSIHLDDREGRLKLSLYNARPIHYFEVLKSGARQVHCLYEDSTLIVFNKKTGKIITIMLLGRKKLTEYLNVANESLSERIPMQRCAKAHERLVVKDGKFTEDTAKQVRIDKIKYLRLG